ncbi:MAG: heat-inducible transcriptional repressor HrcA, partial [Pseudomonadota bacterium]
MPTDQNPLSDLDERSREVFRRLVESYLDNGGPVGSRTLSRAMSEPISAATIRNTMQDLEILGLLDSPHISAGRIPTELGLRLFLDGFLEIGTVSEMERNAIEREMDGPDPDISSLLDRAGQLLSGLTQGASLVLAPKSEAEIRHLEFVSLSSDRTLVVIVFDDGQVENRIFTPPSGLTPSAMREAANFLSTLLQGKTLSQMRSSVGVELAKRRQEIDTLASSLIEAGLAMWESEAEDARLIVRGRANLLEDTVSAEELDRIRSLFDDLERKRD